AECRPRPGRDFAHTFCDAGHHGARHNSGNDPASAGRASAADRRGKERFVVSEYRLRRRVQFYETDAAGIVHFSWFFRYMEEAEHALWREAGLSIHPPDSDIGWPRVAASFDFQRALRFEDEFDVHLRIADLSQRTIRYECV